MEKPIWRKNASTLGLTLLRVTVGTIMLAHGIQKLGDPVGFRESIEGLGIPAPQFFAYLAITAEVLGGAGLILGFLTPIAAFGIASTMVVAITKVHWSHGLFAQDGGFEYPLVLLLTALFFIANGAGDLSFDALIMRFRNRPPAHVRPAARPVPPPMPLPPIDIGDDDEDPVSIAGKQSFPASDPPAYGGRH